MIAGEPPFVGRTGASLMRAHIVEAPTPVATKRADVPEALGALIERCLEKDPVDRPASAPEIIEGPGDLMRAGRSGEHTAELQSPCKILCRLLLLKKKKHRISLTVPLA